VVGAGVRPVATGSCDELGAGAGELVTVRAVVFAREPVSSGRGAAGTGAAGAGDARPAPMVVAAVPRAKRLTAVA
jgi:hypothetical protein